MQTANVIKLDSRRPKPKARSKSFRKYQTLLTGKRAMTKNEIMGFCWAMNGVKAIKLDSTDRRELMELFEAKAERPITKEQTEFGIAWLRKYCFKANGEPRKRCPLDRKQQAIVEHFNSFAWVGIYNTQEHFGNWNGCKSYVPVWRVFGTHGGYFDYAVIGGGPGGSVELVLNP